MPYTGLLRLGGVEIANTRRTVAYMSNGVMPLTSQIMKDPSWQDTARYLGQIPYTLPANDVAPWLDVNDADSLDFAGLWVHSIDGLDNSDMKRAVVDSISDGGSFDRPQYPPRSLKVEGVLYAKSPQGVDYGLRWITSVLRGDRCVRTWEGQTLEYLASMPATSDSMASSAFKSCTDRYERYLYDVAMTSAPKVTERFGKASGYGIGSCALKIEFELTAGTPWAFRRPTLLATNLTWNTSGAADVLQFVIAPNGVCPDGCPPSTADYLVDPLGPAPVELIRANETSTAGRLPLDSRTLSTVIPKNALPTFHDMLGTTEIKAGPKAERNLRIRWARKTSAQTAAQAVACNPLSEVFVSYLPEYSTLKIDGPSGRAYVTTSAGTVLDASPVVDGPDGSPWRVPIMSCTSDYAVVVDASGDISSAASVSITGRVGEQ